MDAWNGWHSPRWARHGRYLQGAGSKIFFIRLLQMLYPEVAEQLYGRGPKTSVEQFCETNPVPAAVAI